jgi:curved DNA-binding protein CbpA
MNSLYEILGIPKTATADQIKKAYRKLAKKLHPDSNPGEDSAAKFHVVQEAYEVLSDPEFRARYDQTGEIPKRTKQPDHDAELISSLHNLLTSVLGDMWIDHTNTDLVDRMTKKMRDHRRTMEGRLQTIQANLKKYRAIAKRFEVDEATENYLVEIVRTEINAGEASEADQKKQLDICTRVLNYLKKCKYRTDKDSLKVEFRVPMIGQWVQV